VAEGKDKSEVAVNKPNDGREREEEYKGVK